MGQPANKKKEQHVVKQFSGPTIYLGKNNESKLLQYSSFTLPTLEF